VSRRAFITAAALSIAGAVGIGGYLSLRAPDNTSTALSSLPRDGFCLGGCPTGAPPENQTVRHNALTLSNNPDTKFADWVAYRIAPETLSTKRCARAWRADPALPPAATLDPIDYKRLSEAGYQRGHIAPLASLCGTPYWLETDYMSNVAPQRPDLNGGAWEKLEAAERRLIKNAKGYTSVYAIAGPLYEDPMPPLPHASKFHVVPSGFWKIIGAERNGTVETAAFAMLQTVGKNASFCASRTTVAAIEQRTNLRFFPLLDEPKRTERASRNDRRLLADLGCR
jgi:endonuclease G